MAILIRGAQVIDGSSSYHLKTVDILVDKGRIIEIGKSLKTTTKKIIEAKGLCVSPGWVDIFADYCEPGYEHKETIQSGLRAAAAGGFTEVFVAPDTEPAMSTKAQVKFVLGQAEGNIVRTHPIGSVSHNKEGKSLAEMLDMQSAGAIAFSDGWKPVQQTNLMLKALEYVKSFDGTLIQIPQDASLAAGGLMHEGPESTRLGMPGIPAIAETIALHKDIELLRYTGSRLHVTGISSAESVDMIRKAKKEGLNISCSVTPYHLVLNDEIMRTYDAAYKVTPPIRSELDRKALVKGLKDGTIDCIASHHHPQDWDAKTKEFDYAASGMNLQESVFPVIWNTLSEQVPAERIADALGARARVLFGLEPASVEKNHPVNLTLFSTSMETITERPVSKSANNPFIGQKLNGTVIGIMRGEQISLTHKK
ncbi:MAG: dihydroorotase [Chitinophagaceae bacterium]